MRPYDDDRYLQWRHEFQKLISEFLDTDGNSVETLESEYDQAVEEAET